MADILVIDDEALFRDLLSQVLSGLGHTVATAEDGRLGVQAARQNVPDLVITDMSMPGMTGWDVIRTLKSDPVTAGVPIIALTAHSSQDDRIEGYEAGCDAFIAKPLDVPQLLKQVSAVLP